MVNFVSVISYFKSFCLPFIVLFHGWRVFCLFSSFCFCVPSHGSGLLSLHQTCLLYFFFLYSRLLFFYVQFVAVVSLCQTKSLDRESLVMLQSQQLTSAYKCQSVSFTSSSGSYDQGSRELRKNYDQTLSISGSSHSACTTTQCCSV